MSIVDCRLQVRCPAHAHGGRSNSRARETLGSVEIQRTSLVARVNDSLRLIAVAECGPGVSAEARRRPVLASEIMKPLVWVSQVESTRSVIFRMMPLPAHLGQLPAPPQVVHFAVPLQSEQWPVPPHLGHSIRTWPVLLQGVQVLLRPRPAQAEQFPLPLQRPQAVRPLPWHTVHVP